MGEAEYESPSHIVHALRLYIFSRKHRSFSPFLNSKGLERKFLATAIPSEDKLE